MIVVMIAQRSVRRKMFQLILGFLIEASATAGLGYAQSITAPSVRTDGTCPALNDRDPRRIMTGGSRSVATTEAEFQTEAIGGQNLNGAPPFLEEVTAQWEEPQAQMLLVKTKRGRCGWMKEPDLAPS